MDAIFGMAFIDLDPALAKCVAPRYIRTRRIALRTRALSTTGNGLRAATGLFPGGAQVKRRGTASRGWAANRRVAAALPLAATPPRRGPATLLVTAPSVRAGGLVPTSCCSSKIDWETALIPTRGSPRPPWSSWTIERPDDPRSDLHSRVPDGTCSSLSPVPDGGHARSAPRRPRPRSRNLPGPTRSPRRPRTGHRRSRRPREARGRARRQGESERHAPGRQRRAAVHQRVDVAAARAVQERRRDPAGEPDANDRPPARRRQ